MEAQEPGLRYVNAYSFVMAIVANTAEQRMLQQWIT
jgi:hypothetical protein